MENIPNYIELTNFIKNVVKTELCDNESIDNDQLDRDPLDAPYGDEEEVSGYNEIIINIKEDNRILPV